MKTMFFNVFDCYWKVAGDLSHVWSSARQASVLISDSIYTAWLAVGNLPRPIASYAELYDVLLSRAPLIAASVVSEWVNSYLTPAQGLNYRISIGIAITSTGTPDLNAIYDITPDSQMKITGIITGINAGRGIPGGGSTFAWQDISGVPHEFTGDQFTDLAAVIESYMYSLYMTEAVLLNGGTVNWPDASATIA